MAVLDFPLSPTEGDDWTDNDGVDWLFWRGAWQQLGAGAVLGSVPGDVKLHAGATIPEGYILCDGQALDRVTYIDLFDAINTIYGAGDGSTTFNVPDMRGRVIAGLDAGAGRITDPAGNTLGGVLGAETHALTENELRAHTHPATIDAVADHNHGANLSNTSVSGTVSGTTGSGGGHGHTISAHGGGGTADGVPSGSSVNIRRQATVATTSVSNHNHSFSSSISGGSVSGNVNVDAGGGHGHTATIDNTGGNAAHNNLQPTTFMNWVIKF